MTEKRFRLGYVCGDFGLIDDDEWIDLHSMSENSEKNVQICIRKMNELADENEHLKQSMDKLFDYFQKWFEEERGVYIEDFIMLWNGIKEGDVE